MQFERLIDFIEYQSYCTFCDSPMPLSFYDYRGNKDANGTFLSCSIHNNICRINILHSVAGNIDININTNQYAIIKKANHRPSNSEEVISTAISLTERKIRVYRKCCMCSSEMRVQSSPLKFKPDGTFDTVDLSYISFGYVNPTIRKIDKINVINNYLDKKTSLTHYKMTEEEYFPTLKIYKELPLVNFDFSCKDKTLEKIRMLTVFS